jgi:hypothetical protein
MLGYNKNYFKGYGKELKKRGAYYYEEDGDPFGFRFLVCGVLALFPARRS